MEAGAQQLALAELDVLVTDLRLPDDDALPLVRMAREQGIRVVVVTGHATVEGTIEAMEQGVDAFLLKPFRLSALHAAIQKALHRRTQERRQTWAQQALRLVLQSETVQHPDDADKLFPALEAVMRGIEGVQRFEILPGTSGGRHLGGHHHVQLSGDPGPGAVFVEMVDRALRRLGR